MRSRAGYGERGELRGEESVLERLLERERRHASADVGRQLDEAVSLQRDQRFSDRDGADVVPSGQLAQDESCPGKQASVEDLLPQPLIDRGRLRTRRDARLGSHQIYG